MSLFNTLVDNLKESSTPLTLSEQILMMVAENLDENNVLTKSKEEIANDLQCEGESLGSLVVDQTFEFLQSKGLLVKENNRYRVA